MLVLKTFPCKIGKISQKLFDFYSACAKIKSMNSSTGNDTSTTYSLTYDPNGGEGGPAPTSRQSNQHYAIFHADPTAPTRQGFVFSGWSFSPDGPVEVSVGDLFTVTSQDVTLYAVWATEGSAVTTDNQATDSNTKPLGVVASSDDTSDHMISGEAFGATLLACVLGAIILCVVVRVRRPRIVSKDYDSTDDFDL